MLSRVTDQENAIDHRLAQLRIGVEWPREITAQVWRLRRARKIPTFMSGLAYDFSYSVPRPRIAQLSDEELIRIVKTDRAQYRDEAILCAEAELQGRGLRVEAAGANQTGTDESRTGGRNRPQGGGSLNRVEESPAPVVEFRVFQGTFSTWEALLSEAADFATSIGPTKLISISQSADKYDGVVTVWYWS